MRSGASGFAVFRIFLAVVLVAVWVIGRTLFDFILSVFSPLNNMILALPWDSMLKSNHTQMKSSKEWKGYEEEIAAHFMTAYPGAKVRHNVKLPGAFTGIARQVDVLIEAGSAELPIKIAVETRHLGRKIDVGHVEGFLP